ncbi:ras association domain-containing protein 8 isoform X2 [Pristis pectinata]|uniref:ras association domain-containing protein 8 isoform X2 n=1 Tax=Pristis pectinata TaxID=685728 RepID=UPI00223CFB2A|nr:ras association domain-containing protein 8 isoform X2 [Pristis pectinata]
MELRVWVEGVQRVVCGVTEDTSCQQVVIALAQAIGQTGRYVLVQSLRDSERQLLPTECPLQLLARSGQYANDVRFVLHHTGPSTSDRLGSDSSRPQGLTAGGQAPRRRELKKSLTFTGGAGEVSVRDRWQARRGQEPAAEEGAPTRDQLFQLILRQQQQLQEIAERHASCDRELERDRPGCRDRELEEAAARTGEEEEEEYWEQELRAERERERELLCRLGELRCSLKESSQQLLGLSNRAQLLGREMEQEGERAREQQAAQLSSREAIGRVQAQIHSRAQQNQQIQTSILELDRMLQETEHRLQVKALELEELNKELRQCNLQQFIRQTGSAGGHGRSEEQPLPEEPRHHRLQNWSL